MVLALGIVGFVMTVLVIVGMVLITPSGSVAVGGPGVGGSELSLDQNDPSATRPRQAPS